MTCMRSTNSATASTLWLHASPKRVRSLYEWRKKPSRPPPEQICEKASAGKPISFVLRSAVRTKRKESAHFWRNANPTLKVYNFCAFLWQINRPQKGHKNHKSAPMSKPQMKKSSEPVTPMKIMNDLWASRISLTSGCEVG